MVEINSNRRLTPTTDIEFWNGYHVTPKGKLLGGKLPLLADMLNKKIPKNKDVLELGCGIKMADKPYESRDASFIGGDISLSALIEAKKNFKRGRYINLDACSLPFRDKQFDIVLAYDMVSALGTRVDIGLYEMLRVARSDVIFTVAHENQHLTEIEMGSWDLYKDDKKYGKVINFDKTENVVFTEPSLTNLITDQPFKLESINLQTYTNAQLYKEYGLPPDPEDHVRSYIAAMIRK